MADINTGVGPDGSPDSLDGTVEGKSGVVAAAGVAVVLGGVDYVVAAGAVLGFGLGGTDADEAGEG